VTSFIQTIKAYKMNSVFFKILKKFIAITIIPFIIISALITIYYHLENNKQQRGSIIDKFETNADSLEEAFTETEQIYNLLAVNSDYSAFFAMDTMNTITAKEHASVNRLVKSVNTYKSLYSSITAINIYSYLSNYNICTGNYELDFSDDDISPKLNSKSPYFIMPIQKKANSADKSSFAICYYYYTAGVPCGIISFIITSELFTDISSDTTYNKIFQALCLYDSDFNLVYASASDIPNIFEPAPDTSLYIKEKNSALILSQKTDIGYLCSYTDTSNMTGIFNQNSILAIFALCILFSFITAIVLSLIAATDSYRMVQQIITTIDCANETNGEVDLIVEPMNELIYISDNIIKLHSRNKSLETVLVSKIHELKTMQNTALQVQYTPHFLFNTLNCINLIALRELGPKNSIGHLIVILSDLLSFSLNTKQYIINIKEEVSYCKKYIEIESIKNNNNFDAIWEIDDDLLMYKTPKCILQPIIENAFKHGLKHLDKNTRGLLVISIYKSENDIIFEIRNNGAQIPKITIDQLNKSLKTADTPSSGRKIGMSNVNSRLKIIFGDNYGCTISSDEYGCVVKIKIAALKDIPRNMVY